MGEAIELRQRHGDHLNLTECQGLERVVIVHELARWVHLDHDASREAFLGELFEALCGLSFRRPRRCHVREFDEVDLILRSFSAAACTTTAASDERARGHDCCEAERAAHK